MPKKQLIAAWMILLTLLTISPVFSGDNKPSELIGPFNIAPVPRLLQPVSDKIVLTGKDSLEFKWWNDFISADHFIFRIYKGYNMYESDLIYKENLPSAASSIKIKSGLFEDGRVYTWSLVLVYLGGKKSEKGFSSFKVVKK